MKNRLQPLNLTSDLTLAVIFEEGRQKDICSNFYTKIINTPAQQHLYNSLSLLRYAQTIVLFDELLLALLAAIWSFLGR